MTTRDRKPALGRGLDALIPAASVSAKPNGEALFTCPIERVVPQKGQPRQIFDDQKLEELAQSIREQGVLQPLLVRKAPLSPGTGGDMYEIIAGERRWRAAQRAGLRDVPVIVKEMSPAASFEAALIENLQRDDLNPVEQAEAFERLMRERGYTQEALAERVGKDRATVANSVRLLKLPPRVRQMVVEGALSEGHARALLGAQEPQKIELLAEKVARAAMSVREAERLVRASAKPSKPDPGAESKSASVRDLEERLSRRLGTRTEVRDHKGKGEIAIRYASLDELDRILDLLLK
jgi:ParB family chromosome partitioning protein